MLFGDEHVRRYEETDGAEGHDWQGTTTLILTTSGRKSGQQRQHPLIYQKHGGRLPGGGVQGRGRRAAVLVSKPGRQP